MARDIGKRIITAGQIKKLTESTLKVATVRAMLSARLDAPSSEYFNFIRNTAELTAPPCRPGKGSSIGDRLRSANEGLCGGVDSRIAAFCNDFFSKNNASYIYVFGKQTAKMLNYPVYADDLPDFGVCAGIADEICRLNGLGEDIGVTVIYASEAETIDAISLLPLKSSCEKSFLTDIGKVELYHFILPRYLAAGIFRAAIRSYAVIQNERVRAMDSASDNASELLDDLYSELRRGRQAKITQEISETYIERKDFQ